MNNTPFSSSLKQLAWIKILNLGRMPILPSWGVLHFCKFTDWRAFPALPSSCPTPLKCKVQLLSILQNGKASCVTSVIAEWRWCKKKCHTQGDWERREVWETHREGKGARKYLSHWRALPRPNQKLSHPFFLPFLVWSQCWDVPRYFLVLDWRAGKQWGVGSITEWVDPGSELALCHQLNTAFQEHHGVDLGGLSIKQGWEWGWGRKATWRWPHEINRSLPRTPTHFLVTAHKDKEFQGLPQHRSQGHRRGNF